MFQISCDTNPDVPDHSWMYQREDGRTAQVCQIRLCRQSLLFQGGSVESKVGKTTVEELDRGLTGIFTTIGTFKGLRRAPEGMVFDLADSDIIEELPDMSRWLHYNAMDFGMSAPSVCLWIAENPQTEEVVVYQ